MRSRCSSKHIYRRQICLAIKQLKDLMYLLSSKTKLNPQLLESWESLAAIYPIAKSTPAS